MHPDKFLGRATATAKPEMSDGERDTLLVALGQDIAKKREEAIDARKTSGIESVWMECESAYLGIDDANRHEFSGAQWAKPSDMAGPLTRESGYADNSKSTIFPRLTSRYVDTASAKLCEIILPIGDKAFKFGPTPDPEMVKLMDNKDPVAIDGQPVITEPEDGPPQQATNADLAKITVDKATDCAKKAETRVYDWMVESKYPAETRKVVHDGARIGVGVLKGPFPEAKTLRAMTKKQGAVGMEMVQKIAPAMRWIDPWNFFPQDGCGEDIHDGEHVFERDLMSVKKLKKLKEQPGYIKEKIDQVLAEGPGKCYVDGREENKSNKKRFEIWYYYGTVKREMLTAAKSVGAEDLPEDKEDVDVIVSMVNDSPIRAVINPLDSGSFPYRVMTWSRRPGHWAGVGVAEQISAPQRMVTAATRALLNNTGVSSGVQIILDQLGIVPADGSWKITPNKVWYKTAESMSASVKDAFNAIVIPNIYQAIMVVIEYGMKLAEESCGIPLITQGQTGPSSPETFGQAELQDNNAHTWLRSIGYRFDDMITDPLVRDLYEYLLLDPEVPDDEKGDFEINAQGSIAMVERAIQEMFFLNLMQMSANPAFKIDPAKVAAMAMKAKRVDPRDVQYSDADQKKMEEQPPPEAPQVQVAKVNAQARLETTKMTTGATLQKAQLDTDRDTLFQQTLNERAKIEDAANQQEMEWKREFDTYKENNAVRRENDKLKAELAMKSAELVTQKELSAAALGADVHKHHNPSPQIATPPTEPAGRAAPGTAYSA